MVQCQGHKCAYGLEGSGFEPQELVQQPACYWYHNSPGKMKGQPLQQVDKPVDILPGLWHGDLQCKIMIRLLLSLGSL